MRVKDCLQPGTVSTASTSPQTEYKELWFASYFAHINSTFSLIFFLNDNSKIQRQQSILINFFLLRKVKAQEFWSWTSVRIFILNLNMVKVCQVPTTIPEESYCSATQHLRGKSKLYLLAMDIWVSIALLKRFKIRTCFIFGKSQSKLCVAIYITAFFSLQGDWCVRFPKNLQEPGARFVVDGLIPNEKYYFYRYVLSANYHFVKQTITAPSK